MASRDRLDKGQTVGPIRLGIALVVIVQRLFAADAVGGGQDQLRLADIAGGGLTKGAQNLDPLVIATAARSEFCTVTWAPRAMRRAVVVVSIWPTVR